MRDGPIRATIKSAAMLRFYIDLWLWRLWRRVRGLPPRFDVQGSCEGCGQCCETPTLQVPYVLLRYPPILNIFLWWQRIVNGFDFVRADIARHELVFTCTHYDRVSKECDSYATRPGMCRDYPINLRYAERAQLFDECSFVLVDRLEVRLDTALHAAGLPPEKIAEIKQRLAQKRYDDGHGL